MEHIDNLEPFDTNQIEANYSIWSIYVINSYHMSWRFFAEEVKNRLLKHKTFLNLENIPYDFPLNLILRLLEICTKTGNKIFKIPYTWNGPEIIFCLGLYDIVVISRIIAVYQILDWRFLASSYGRRWGILVWWLLKMLYGLKQIL